MTEVVIRDDAPVSQPVRPIIRIGGETCIAGTTVRTRAVYESHVKNVNWSPSDTARHYGITLEQVDFAVRYEAKKAKRKDPVRRQLRRNGKACKNRGYAFEKYLESRLGRFGFKRMFMSGALGGSHAGDLRRESKDRWFRLPGGPGSDEGYMPSGAASVFKIEAKRREAEQRFVRDALKQGGGSQVAIVGKLGLEPIAFMELSQLERLLSEAGYEVAGNGPDDTPGAASTTQGGA